MRLTLIFGYAPSSYTATLITHPTQPTTLHITRRIRTRRSTVLRLDFTTMQCSEGQVMQRLDSVKVPFPPPS